MSTMEPDEGTQADAPRSDEAEAAGAQDAPRLDAADAPRLDDDDATSSPDAPRLDAADSDSTDS